MRQLLLSFYLCVIFCFASCDQKQKPEESKVTNVEPADKETVSSPAKPTSEIPDLTITFADGSVESAKNLKGKFLLVLFQPDCDHCQREAQDFKNNMEHFRNIPLYFVSAAPMDEVLKFADDYQLSQFSNIRWGTTTVPKILDAFGPIEAPSAFLYDENGVLVQNFNGEVAVEVIVRSL